MCREEDSWGDQPGKAPSLPQGSGKAKRENYNTVYLAISRPTSKTTAYTSKPIFTQEWSRQVKQPEDINGPSVH